jgi:hypothetical protein
MSFSETFSIVNNSGDTFYPDQIGSENLGDGDWPATVAPRSNGHSFETQTATSNNITVLSIGNAISRSALADHRRKRQNKRPRDRSAAAFSKCRSSS